MSKKKPVRVLDLVKDKAKEISKQYEGGMDIRSLAEEHGCSHNTMMITIGTLGYEVEPWARPFVKKKLEALERDKLKRIKKKQPILDL